MPASPLWKPLISLLWDKDAEHRLRRHRPVALALAAVAFLPLLGWANWLIIPLAIVGAAVGMASRSKAGRNLNFFVIVVGVLRLMLGGGIL